MPIITCTNPNTPEGYDANNYGEQGGLLARHREEAHEVTYEGCVLDTFERNMHDDSDFCAIVYNKEEARVEVVQYATTRGWTYHNTCAVDATPEVVAAAEAVTINRLAEQYIREWSIPAVGKRVKSKTTRGRYVGCEGVISQIKPSDFNRYGTVGVFKVDNFVDFRYPATVDTERLEVIEPLDREACFQRATEVVKRTGIRSVVRAAEFGR